MRSSFSNQRIITRLLIPMAAAVFAYLFSQSNVFAACGRYDFATGNVIFYCADPSSPRPDVDCYYYNTTKPCRGVEAASDKCGCGGEGAIGFKSIVAQALPTFKFKDAKLGDVINSLLPYAFTLAGIILFILLIASGFEFLTSGGDEKKLAQAKGRITSALLGFIIIVAAYWLTQIIEFLFHIQIL